MVFVFISLSIGVNAQKLDNLFNKKKSNTDTKSSEPKETIAVLEEIPDDFKDEWGFSGRYHMVDTSWALDSYGRKTKTDGQYKYATTQKWKFVREENGNVVNKLIRYEGMSTVRGYISNGFVLFEKFKEKFNVNAFKNEYNSNTYLMVQLEDGVWGEALVDLYKYNIKTYYNTFAKDPSKLELYDNETGAAKMQQILNDIKNKAADVEREKWMKNETFAKMVGKIGFIDQYSKVSYNKGDVLEKTDVFASSIELGKQSLFYRAYFKTPGDILCAGCELNTTYEIEGIKVSRVEQRKVSAKWSRMIKQKFVDGSFFTGAPSIVSFSENVADYAFLYCIYQNKDKIKDGKSLKMKVTLTTNQDGVDKDILAEGTITLVYKAANKAGYDKMIKWMEDFLSE